MIIESMLSEYRRYKALAEMALSQVKDDDLHKSLGAEGNSIAVIMTHLSGNLKSRFTAFLTDDGEKPWRRRDEEFEETHKERASLLALWEEAWNTLFDALRGLEDQDLGRMVRIRGKELTISDALQRSLTHLSYHVGQIVLLARLHAGREWKSLSIPRGSSREYNLNPKNERHPDQPSNSRTPSTDQ